MVHRPRSAGVLLLVLLSATAQNSPRLAFSHKIGDDWRGVAPHWMNFVAISGDGQTVAANGSVPEATASALGFWTFPAGTFVRSLTDHPIAIAADFHYLASESGVRDLQTGQETFHIARPADIVTAAAFSPSGAYVALVEGGHVGRGQRGRIMVLNAADGSLISSFGNRHTEALAFHPDNQTLASGHWNNVTLWNAQTGAREALLMSPQRSADPTGYNRDGRYIVGLAFSPDGEIVAAGSDDGELQLWNVRTRTLLHALKIGWSDVSNPAFSPDGKLVAAGTYADGTVSLIDVSSATILSKLQVSMFGCGSVTFSPDGRYLITPSNGGLLNNGTHDRGGTIRVFRVTP